MALGPAAEKPPLGVEHDLLRWVIIVEAVFVHRHREH